VHCWRKLVCEINTRRRVGGVSESSFIHSSPFQTIEEQGPTAPPGVLCIPVYPVLFHLLTKSKGLSLHKVNLGFAGSAAVLRIRKRDLCTASVFMHLHVANLFHLLFEFKGSHCTEAPCPVSSWASCDVAQLPCRARNKVHYLIQQMVDELQKF